MDDPDLASAKGHVSTENSYSRTRFSKLPSELVLHILKLSPDFTTLWAALEAWGDVKKLFLEHSLPIFESVLASTLAPSTQNAVRALIRHRMFLDKVNTSPGLEKLKPSPNEAQELTARLGEADSLGVLLDLTSTYPLYGLGSSGKEHAAPKLLYDTIDLAHQIHILAHAYLSSSLRHGREWHDIIRTQSTKYSRNTPGPPQPLAANWETPTCAEEQRVKYVLWRLLYMTDQMGSSNTISNNASTAINNRDTNRIVISAVFVIDCAIYFPNFMPQFQSIYSFLYQIKETRSLTEWSRPKFDPSKTLLHNIENPNKALESVSYSERNPALLLPAVQTLLDLPEWTWQSRSPEGNIGEMSLEFQYVADWIEKPTKPYQHPALQFTSLMDRWRHHGVPRRIPFEDTAQLAFGFFDFPRLRELGLWPEDLGSKPCYDGAKLCYPIYDNWNQWCEVYARVYLQALRDTYGSQRELHPSDEDLEKRAMEISDRNLKRWAREKKR